MDIAEEYMVNELKDDAEGLERFRNKWSRKRKERQRCSCMIAIGMKRVPNSKGRFMPEWEEIAAVASAVQVV